MTREGDLVAYESGGYCFYCKTDWVSRTFGYYEINEALVDTDLRYPFKYTEVEVKVPKEML